MVGGPGTQTSLQQISRSQPAEHIGIRDSGSDAGRVTGQQFLIWEMVFGFHSNSDSLYSRVEIQMNLRIRTH